MNNMNHYYAVKKDVGFQLLPVSKDAVYIAGTFLAKEKILRMFHPATHPEFEYANKVNEWGEKMMKKWKTPEGKMVDRDMMERRTTVNNFYFDFTGEDMVWFIDTYVENADKAHEYSVPTGHQNNPEEGNEELAVTG